MKFVPDYIFKVVTLFLPNANTAKNSGKRLVNLACGDKDAKGKYFEGEKEMKSSTAPYSLTLKLANNYGRKVSS